MTAPRYTFPRSHRLSGRVEFGRVFEAKVRSGRGPITLYVRENELGHPRLGISIGRKVGTAVVRNRIKRLVREAYRHLRHDVPGAYDLVVVVRPHEPFAAEAYREILASLIERTSRKWREREGTP